MVDMLGTVCDLEHGGRYSPILTGVITVYWSQVDECSEHWVTPGTPGRGEEADDGEEEQDQVETSAVVERGREQSQEIASPETRHESVQSNVELLQPGTELDRDPASTGLIHSLPGHS